MPIKHLCNKPSSSLNIGKGFFNSNSYKIYVEHKLNLLLLQSIKVHGGASDTFGLQLKVGDIVGCFLDVTDQTISELPQIGTKRCYSDTILVLGISS